MKQTFALLLMCSAVAACNGSASPSPSGAGGQGTAVKLGGLSSKTPADWKMENTTGSFRVYQFKVPKAAGDSEDAELVISFFEGGAGPVAENIKRWQGMFVPNAGKTIDDVSKVEKFKVGQSNVTYLDVAGTFLSKNPPFDPKAKTEKKSDFRRFGVILEVPNGAYYLTLTGPARTMEQNKKSFDEWLKNFK